MSQGSHLILVVDPDAAMASALALACAEPTEIVESDEVARNRAQADHAIDVCVTVIVGPTIDLDVALSLASELRRHNPAAGVIVLRPRLDTAILTAALRAGVREVLTERELPELSDAVRRSYDIAKFVGPSNAADLHRATVTTVFAAKGGVGKTTVSTCLAVHLAERGDRVVIVDLDLAFGDVAVTLNLFPQRTIADFTSGSDISATNLDSVLAQHSSGLRILAAPAEPSAIERISVEMVSTALALLVSTFDHVIIDTPPALDERVLAAFDSSDLLVLVATLDVPALKNLRLALDTLDLIGVPRERQRVVLNRADAEVGVLLSDVPDALEREVFAAIPSSRDVPASVNSGVPIVSALPDHPVSVAIRRFADAALPPADSPSTEARRAIAEPSRRAWPRLRRPVSTP